MSMVALKKDGSKLYFEFSNGQSVIYDYKDKSYVSKTGRKVTANTVKGYLTGMTLDNVDVENSDLIYLNLLRHIKTYNETNRTSLGGLLELAGTPKYQLAERFYLCGIELKFSLSYHHHKRIGKNTFKNLKKYAGAELHKDYWLYVVEQEDILRMLDYICEELAFDENRENLVDALYYRREDLRYLVETRNYNWKSLCNYLFQLYTREGLGFNESILHLKDEARMRFAMSINGKFEKYPKYLLSTHIVTTRNYNAHKRMYDEILFASVVNTGLEYKSKDYSIITPKCSQDVIQEGQGLNHCVASYVDRIMQGKCQIVFMRESDFLEDSLVTIEIRDGNIVQYKGAYNRSVTDKEMDFIKKYARAKNLKIK